MEMDFVELEHRPDVATLMEACSIDLETALHLYHRHHCDLQAAISEKLGLVSPQRVPPSPRDHLTMSFEDDGDYEFQRYCRFVEEGPGFLKRYPLPPEKKSSSTQNHSFKRDIENFLGRKISLTIEGGKIEDGLRWSWKHKFPVALLLLDFQKSNPQVTEALSDSFLSDLGTCFRVYGMDPSSCRIDQWLSRFIVLPADSTSLLLFRINFLDQIETLAKIQLAAADLKTRVQRAKSEGIQHELDEAHIIKQHALMRTGRPYHRPQPIRQKIKQREDAKLRKQQDDEFIKACLPRNNLPQSSPLPMVSLEQLKAKRQERRGRLKVYDEGIQVKLRMPSGKAILLFIAEAEPVQYLFDFVDTSPEDIGFERDQQRHFDIVYGPNKNKSLQQLRDSTIGSVLEECQVLIVKETDE